MWTPSTNTNVEIDMNRNGASVPAEAPLVPGETYTLTIFFQDSVPKSLDFVVGWCSTFKHDSGYDKNSQRHTIESLERIHKVFQVHLIFGRNDDGHVTINANGVDFVAPQDSDDGFRLGFTYPNSTTGYSDTLVYRVAR